MDELMCERELLVMLDELGVPHHMCGYEYLRQAVLVAVRDPQAVYAVMKEIYPVVAASFGVRPYQVEGGIRRAVAAAWERGSRSAQALYFGNTVAARRGKPTNAECIAKLAERLHNARETRAAQEL